MIVLHALLVRRSDLTHQEFLDYWHGSHGPLIRDNPNLARHVVAYSQHPLAPSAAEFGLDTYDGVTVQVFADWDAFRAFIREPDARSMDADMESFLDVSGLRVAVAEGPVSVIGEATAGVVAT